MAWIDWGRGTIIRAINVLDVDHACFETRGVSGLLWKVKALYRFDVPYFITRCIIAIADGQGMFLSPRWFKKVVEGCEACGSGSIECVGFPYPSSRER